MILESLVCEYSMVHIQPHPVPDHQTTCLQICLSACLILVMCKQGDCPAYKYCVKCLIA